MRIALDGTEEEERVMCRVNVAAQTLTSINAEMMER